MTSPYWEDGSPVCPKCNAAQGERNHYWLAKQKRWKCYQCYKQFSVKVGTIFEDSPISLTKWLPAMWLLVNCKNGVSSYEVSRDLGISQKAAWFVLQRLRHILKDTTVIPMRGPVEVDESFHGGKPKNMHRSRRLRLQVGENGYSEKTAVFGMLDRETRKVRAQVVPNVKRDTLQKAILDRVFCCQTEEMAADGAQLQATQTRCTPRCKGHTAAIFSQRLRIR